MTSRTVLIAAFVCLATSGFVACDDVIGQGCTEIGCFDGLRVVVQGVADVEYEVVASELDGATQTGACQAVSDGTCSVFFFQYYPSEVTLHVTGADQSLSITLQPAYEESQPNGPDCPPTCRLSTVEVDLRPSAQLSNTRLELTR
jgi:hypothetical protein